MAIDMITLATIQGALTSIIDEMSHVVVNTARSPIFKFAKDFSCTICDWDGRQLVQGEAELPVHVGSISIVCQAVARVYRDDINPGDCFLCNDPAHGGLHVPDTALLRPIFIDNELAFWTVIRAHWLDIGGPAATDLARAQSDCLGEGLRIPPVRIYERGKRIDPVFNLIFANVRYVESQKADMLSMMAACDIASSRLSHHAKKYGLNTVKECAEELFDRMEKRTRIAIEALPDGCYEGSSWFAARHGDIHIELNAEVKIEGDDLSVRLSSPPQLLEVRNSPFGATHAAVGHAAAISLGLKPPLNDGLYRAIKIDYGPIGTVTNARVPPAPTLGCTTQPWSEIVDCVRVALSRAIPHERQTAGWCAANSTQVMGLHPETGEYYTHLQSNGGTSGGAGAVHGLDGWSGTGGEQSAGGIQKEPIELVEYEMPFLFHRLEYRTDSGGAGRWRGGLAVDCEWEPLEHDQTMRFNSVIDTFPAIGVDGAKSRMIEPKLGCRAVIQTDGTLTESRGNSRMHAKSGDRLELRPPGGGGVGNAYERDVDQVLADVLDGLVSIEGARIDYGVVIDPVALTVDTKKTREMRAS